jgi:hypothetical protein
MKRNVTVRFALLIVAQFLAYESIVEPQLLGRAIRSNKASVVHHLLSSMLTSLANEYYFPWTTAIYSSGKGPFSLAYPLNPNDSPASSRSRTLLGMLFEPVRISVPAMPYLC